MNIFLVLTAVSLISGVSILSGTTLYTQTSFNTAVMESNMIEDTKNNEMIVSEFLSDGSINVINQGQTNSTIVKLEIFDGLSSIYSTIFGESISGWDGITITEKDTTISPLNNMTLVDAGVIETTSSLTGYITTMFGNTIKITNNYDDSSESSDGDSSESSDGDSNDGISMLDALGTSIYMDIIDLTGRVFYGSTQDGKETSMRPYVGIDSDSTYAAVVQDSDTVIIAGISEFGKSYSYLDGALTQIVVSIPNELGYSSSKIISGNGIFGITDDGINLVTTSGDVLGVAKLSTTPPSGEIIFSGEIEGEYVKLVEEISADLITSNYNSGYGWQVSDSAVSTTLDYNTWSANKYYQGVYYTGYNSFYKNVSSMNVDVSSTSNITLVKTNGNGFSYVLTSYTIGGYQNGDTYKITSINFDSSLGHWYNGSTGEWIVHYTNPTPSSLHNPVSIKIYDSTPYKVIETYTSDFRESYTFPTDKQLYLFVKTSGTTTVKVESYDSLTDLYLEITGLPTNIPFEISKQRVVGARGLTSSLGEISLLAAQVDFGTGFTTSGMLKIYPDSQVYRGLNGGTHLFDVVNGYNRDIAFGDDLIYISPGSMNISFPTAVSVDSVYLDAVEITDIVRNYTKSETIKIPIIPGTKEIIATFNGTEVIIQISDIPSSSIVKAIPAKSDTTSVFELDDSSITSSDISSSVAFTAPKDGTATVIISGSVSGSGTFTMNSAYTGTVNSVSSCSVHGASSPYSVRSCSSNRVAANQGAVSNLSSLTATHQSNLIDALDNGNVAMLSVYADVFINGILIGDPIIIYESTSASVSPSSSSFVSEKSFTAGYTVDISFNQESFGSQIETDVELADYVEVVIRANLETRGIPAPNDNDDSEYSSFASATTTFHGGDIIVDVN